MLLLLLLHFYIDVFQNPKSDFLRFLLCFICFLEHWTTQMTSYYWLWQVCTYSVTLWQQKLLNINYYKFVQVAAVCFCLNVPFSMLTAYHRLGLLFQKKLHREIIVDGFSTCWMPSFMPDTVLDDNILLLLVLLLVLLQQNKHADCRSIEIMEMQILVMTFWSNNQ